MWHHKKTKKPQPGSNDRGWKQQTGVSVWGGGYVWTDTIGSKFPVEAPGLGRGGTTALANV